MPIYQNAVYVPSQDKFYVSSHRHDYVEFEVDGKSYAIDGGCDYLKRSGILNPLEIEDWSLNEENTFEEIKDRMLWGTRGKSGDEPFRWVPLSKCTTMHLKAILRTQPLSEDTHEIVVDKINMTRPLERVLEEMGVVEKVDMTPLFTNLLPRVPPMVVTVIKHLLKERGEP
jgi:hypothetical protein